MQPVRTRDKEVPHVKGQAKAFVLFSVLSLVLALGKAPVAGQDIIVTPANPTISVGQTQQFTATGTGTPADITAGSFHTCALLQDGTVRCWGSNDLGQLGNGAPTASSIPMAVAGIAGPAPVNGSGFHTAAAFPDGPVRSWGH